jgi:hypothetical protein
MGGFKYIPFTRPLGMAFRASVLAAAILAVAAPCCPAGPVPDNATAADSLEHRRAVEKASRSRYRDLEIASLVVILVAGGAAAWWAVKRK